MFACTHSECHRIYKARLLSIFSVQFCGVSMVHVWPFFFLVLLPFGNSRQLKLVDDWKSVDFHFPSEQHRSVAIKTKQFVLGNAVPIDVDVHYTGFTSSSVAKRNQINA